VSILPFWLLLRASDFLTASEASLFAVLSAGTTGTVIAIIVAVANTVGATLRAGDRIVPTEPPRRLAGRGPTAVLKDSRNTGLIAAGITMLIVLALSTAIFGLLNDEWLYSLGVAAFPAALAAAVAALLGLRPWLYHYWLRRRLVRQGLVPWRLTAFLDWCAAPQRAWLRVSDAYEFRHRELLDHLARSQLASPEDEMTAERDTRLRLAQ
jgi:hypothetical protein